MARMVLFVIGPLVFPYEKDQGLRGFKLLGCFVKRLKHGGAFLGGYEELAVFMGDVGGFCVDEMHQTVFAGNGWKRVDGAFGSFFAVMIDGDKSTLPFFVRVFFIDMVEEAIFRFQTEGLLHHFFNV